MIEIKNLTKRFGKSTALDSVSFTVGDGSIFGLVGSNGAGKSTLLRILSGVLKADGGEALVFGENVFENSGVKEKIAFVSDFPYFNPGATLNSMAFYFKNTFSDWNEGEYGRLKSLFKLNPEQKISAMSKGMQRQAAIILALSHKPRLVLFDEIFDGLDPVVRELVKKFLLNMFLAREPRWLFPPIICASLRAFAIISACCTAAGCCLKKILIAAVWACSESSLQWKMSHMPR